MARLKKKRFIPFELHQRWGVLDRQSGELVDTAGAIERYPQIWARNRAEQLNKDYEHEQASSTKDGKTSKGP